MKPKYISYLLNAVLIGIIILYRSCEKPCPELPDPVITHDTITKVDTLTTHDTVWFPKPVSSHDSTPEEPAADSTMIKDYLTYKHHDFNIKDDSAARLNLVIDLWRNSIQCAELKGQVFQKEKVIVETHTVFQPQPIPEKPRLKIYAGIMPGISLKDTSLMISPVIALTTKKDALYTISGEPFKRQIEFGVLWKIKIKK